MQHKQIIGLFVHNHPGVLLRVTSLFTRRGFNIDSLTVSPAAVEGYSRMTIRIQGDDDAVQQFINQVIKIVDVKIAEVLPEESSTSAELILIKVSTEACGRNDVVRASSLYNAEIVDIGDSSLTFRASGEPERIDDLVRAMSEFGIIEMARTGIASLERGSGCLAEKAE